MSTSRPSLVSVVIPCYNVRDYVGRSAASALGQTYPHLEIICVDDGSTDGTAQVLRELEAAHHGRLRVIEGSHRGAPAARNTGLGAAQGEFVQFLDSDDILRPTKIESQVAIAQEAQADLVAGTFHRYYRSGNEEVRQAGEDPWVALVWSQMGVTSANLWRRSAVDAVEGWKEGQHSSQEYELMFRMMKNGARVAFDRAALTEKRDRDGSISSAYDAPVRESYLALCTDVLDYLKTQDMLTPERERGILDSIFIKVRNLYPLDPRAALHHHRRAVPWRYIPSRGGGSSLPFILTYKLFGLGAAERLRSLRS